MKKNDYLVKFSGPYTFEGKEYNEIDLSGITKLTVDDLAIAQSLVAEMGRTAAVIEVDYTYILILASKACGLPIEFFSGLPGKYGAQIKRVVSNYFL